MLLSVLTPVCTHFAARKEEATTTLIRHISLTQNNYTHKKSQILFLYSSVTQHNTAHFSGSVYTVLVLTNGVAACIAELQLLTGESLPLQVPASCKQCDLAINSQLNCANTVLAGQLIPSPLGN